MGRAGWLLDRCVLLLALLAASASAVERPESPLGLVCQDVGRKNILKPDLDTCLVASSLPVEDRVIYTVEVPADVNFDVALVLRSMRGDADL